MKDNACTDNYRYTEPETGEVYLDCDGCGETWPEVLTQSIECPDCGRVRVECPDCKEKYDE